MDVQANRYTGEYTTAKETETMTAYYSSTAYTYGYQIAGSGQQRHYQPAGQGYALASSSSYQTYPQEKYSCSGACQSCGHCR